MDGGFILLSLCCGYHVLGALPAALIGAAAHLLITRTTALTRNASAIGAILVGLVVLVVWVALGWIALAVSFWR